MEKKHYSQASRRTRFKAKRVYVLRNKQIKEPMLIVPNDLPVDEPVIFIPGAATWTPEEIHERVVEKVKKRHWYSWFID